MQLQGTSLLVRPEASAVASGTPDLLSCCHRGTAGPASFALDPGRAAGRPAALMLPTTDDMHRRCEHVPGMTFLEALAALYGFGRLDDGTVTLAQLRAEVCRVAAVHGMAAIRQTARWIWVHGEGIRVDGPHGVQVEYGLHPLVLRMSAARARAGRLCCAYGDDFCDGAA